MIRVCAMTAIATALLLSATSARAQESVSELTLAPSFSAQPPSETSNPPSSVLSLEMLPEDQSVYSPPAPPKEDEGFNSGGVNIDLTFRYMTDNVYRGVSRTEQENHPHSNNLQFEGRLDFNLGKLPHPFIGSFVNIHSSDPISRFQEIRPYFGLNWNLRPFVVEAGNIT